MANIYKLSYTKQNKDMDTLNMTVYIGAVSPEDAERDLRKRVGKLTLTEREMICPIHVLTDAVSEVVYKNWIKTATTESNLPKNPIRRKKPDTSKLPKENLNMPVDTNVIHMVDDTSSTKMDNNN